MPWENLKSKGTMKTCLFAAFLWVGAVTALQADPVILFDDIPSFGVVPTGYHLLNWNGFQSLDGAHYSPPNGYQPAVQSGFNVIYPVNGSTATVSGGLFDFLSVFATAAYNDNVQLEARGYIKGSLVYDRTNTLSATAATLIQYNFYGVDEVDFISSGGSPHAGYAGGSGTYFAFDDVSVVTYVPNSIFVTNGGFETADFSGWSQSGNTSDSTITIDSTYIHSGSYAAKMGPPTTPGFLGQAIEPTEIGQLYSISFWLRNGAPGSNKFGVSWNGTPVFDLTNSPAFGFTNIQFEVVAWRLSEFLQFQFQNDPSYFGFDDLTVTPSVLVSNGGFETGDFSGWTHTGKTNFDQVNAADHLVGAFGSEFGAVDSDSFIAQAITTQPGQPYLVSAWLKNFGGGGPTNEFHASWNGQSLVDLTNLPAGGWTNFHFIALNGSPQNTLQFGFRNDPSAFTFDEASVHPLPILQNGGFEFGDFTGWTRSGNLNETFVSTNTLYASSGYYGAEFGPVGTLGYLSQNVATVPGQTYLIGFTLYVDNPLTNAEFTVSWNGALLMDATNIFAKGSLPFEFPVTAAGTNSTVQFGFRNDPSFFGFDGVFISPIPAPVLQSISRDTNHLVNLSWSALPGYLYELQYATNLSHPNWTNLPGGFQFPTNFPMQGTDTNPPDSQRFYRVQLAPPPLIF